MMNGGWRMKNDLRWYLDLSEGESLGVNLSLSSRSTLIQWQDRVKTSGDWSGCSGWPKKCCVPRLALRIPHCVAVVAVLPVEPVIEVSSGDYAEVRLYMSG